MSESLQSTVSKIRERVAIAARKLAERGGDAGASLIEYALLLALIAIVCLSAVSFLGSSTSSGLSHANSCIAAAEHGATPTC